VLFIFVFEAVCEAIEYEPNAAPPGELVAARDLHADWTFYYNE